MKRLIMIVTAVLFVVSCGQNNVSSIVKDVKIEETKNQKVEVTLETIKGTLDVEKSTYLYFLSYKQALPLLATRFKPAELKKLMELKHLKKFKDGDTLLKVTVSQWETENFKNLKLKDLETTLFAGRPINSRSKKSAEDFLFSVSVSAALIIDPSQLNEGAPKLEEDDDIGGFLDIKEEEEEEAAEKTEKESEETNKDEEKEVIALADSKKDSKPKGIPVPLKAAFEAHGKEKTIDIYGTTIIPSGFGLDNELNFLTEDESKDYIKEFKYKKARRKMGDLNNPNSYTKTETIEGVGFTAGIQVEELR